ncbi:MAG: hypothetical protein AB7W59_12915 [Acidimicrobiia bacterium]
MEVSDHIKLAVHAVATGSPAHSLESATLDFKQTARDLGNPDRSR